jgi:hypothetical protein
MERLILEPTEVSPGGVLNPFDGRMLLYGRSIPENPEAFWSPILAWFYAYAADPAAETIFEFKMEYFNIPSSKRILYILNKMQSMHELGQRVAVNWYYYEEDDFMKEVGSDFSTVVTLPFQLIKVKEELV